MPSPLEPAILPEDNDAPPPAFQKSWKFWAIFPGLCTSSFLTAFDASVVFTALPTIVDDLQSRELYIWIINAYALAMCAVQPLYGQLANIFGRKSTFLAANVLFIVGSCLCGVAKSTNMLIAGRTVQGLGGGGLSVMPGMIICDLVPLRERQKFTSITYAAFAIGTFIGPVLGGVFADTIGWRWIFYIAMMLGGIAVALVMMFFKAKNAREGTISEQFKRIDFLGNAILIASVTSILLALTWGARYPWSSLRCLLPLLLGFVGLAGFLISQTSKSLCPLPTIPLYLFHNRSSLSAYSMTFTHGMLLYWASICLPIYFQGVKVVTPQQSGIDCLASAIPLVPAGIVGGFLIARTGRYKGNVISGFALMLIGLGCFSCLHRTSTVAEWAIFQIIFAAGAGLVLTALLPAIQAPLSDDDTAAATSLWGFVQSFGFIWGAAIPSAIFNSRFNARSAEIHDPDVRHLLSSGGAYQHAVRVFIVSLREDTQQEVRGVFEESLRFTWYIGIVFAGLAFALACVIREYELRRELESTKYTLEK